MKKYLLFLIGAFLISSSFTSAQSYDFSLETSCPVFFGQSDNFSAQKLQMESDKQQLKLMINDTSLKIKESSDKEEKELLKDQLSIWKKELMLLNYRLLILYKNEYISRIIH